MDDYSGWLADYVFFDYGSLNTNGSYNLRYSDSVEGDIVTGDGFGNPNDVINTTLVIERGGYTDFRESGGGTSIHLSWIQKLRWKD